MSSFISFNGISKSNTVHLWYLCSIQIIEFAHVRKVPYRKPTNQPKSASVSWLLEFTCQGMFWWCWFCFLCIASAKQREHISPGIFLPVSPYCPLHFIPSRHLIRILFMLNIYHYIPELFPLVSAAAQGDKHIYMDPIKP